jgi:hypothetical protein
LCRQHSRTVGPCVSATDYRPSLCSARALSIRFSGARLLRSPDHFLALGFRQFVEIVNEPGSLSGLVGRMTAHGRLDRLDGSTSHPMLHLGALRDRIPFLSYEQNRSTSSTSKIIRPQTGSHGPSLGSESYPSRQASEVKKSDHCFAKIPCALKIVRFPAAMAASSRSSLHPRTPRICPGEP